MSNVRKIIDWAIQSGRQDLIGTVVSDSRLLAADGVNSLYVCDVDIGQRELLRNVPIASNNRDLIYAEAGKSVALSRLNNGGYVITGLAKAVRGDSITTYLTASDDVVSISRTVIEDYVIRPLTYGELGTLGPGAYGALPYGIRGRFNRADNELIELLEV